MQILPFTSDGARQVLVDLGANGVYTFITRWNRLASTWSMDILDSDDMPLLRGQALVVGINIIRAYPDLTQLFTEIRVASLDSLNNRADTTLGTTGIVIQVDEGEIPAPTGIQLPPLLVRTSDVTPP